MDCNQLCCQSCVWPKGVPQSPCTYFTTSNYQSDRSCPKCKRSGTCFRDSHVRQRFKEITVEEQQTTHLDGKKNAYEAAKSGLSAAQLAMQRKATELESLA